MLNDFRFEDYAAWRSAAERLRARSALTPDERDELGKWDTLLAMWLDGMEKITGTKRTDDTEIWRYVEEMDFAGANAENLGEAPGVEAVFEDAPADTPQYEEDAFDAHAEREWCLRNIVQAMAVYLTVFTLPSTEDPTGREIAFDLSDHDNPRSLYQWLSYGCLIEDLEQGNTPEGGPYEEARTKPRQVGSTTFWLKLAALFMQCIKRYKVCLQFPLEDDALEHGEAILRDLRRMHELWPDRFHAVDKAKVSKGIIKLTNGSELHIRHGGGSGVKKVGLNFNLFVASEAGKYERHAPDAWKTINTAIIPAVHRGPYNIRAWEGTNDELAYELTRIVDNSFLEHSNVRFRFFGWPIIKDYVGPPILEPEDSAYGRYADYERVEGSDRKPISEKTYCEKHKLSPEQIGFRRQKIDGLGGLDLFHQEYPVTYDESKVSGTIKFFPTAILMKEFPTPKFKANFWSNTRTAGRVTTWKNLKVERDESTGGRWWIWAEPEDTEYVMAADFSDGIPGGDYSAIGVFRVADGFQVAGAKFRGGARNEIVIVDEMVTMVSYYGGHKVRVIGELDGPGSAVRSRWIDYNHPNNYHRLLTRTSFDEYTDSMWYKQAQIARATCLLNMKTAISDGKLIVNDERWRHDAEDFIKHKNGKYAAAIAKSRITGERVMDDQILMSSLAWEGIRTHEKYGRAKRGSAIVTREDPKHPRTEVEHIHYRDLLGGHLGRLIDEQRGAKARRERMGNKNPNGPGLEKV